jgi:hypothetical protein
MNKCSIRALLALFVAAVAVTTTAQAQDDATVESIIEMHIKSMGDVETLKAVKTMVTKSTLTASTPMGDMEIAMKQVQSGNKFVMTQTIPQMGDVSMGSDGEVFWSMNPFQGAQVLEGEQLEAMKSRTPKLFEELTWANDYDGEITLEGTEEVEGKMTYKLVFAPTGGEETERFIDKETGRMVKMIIPTGEVVVSDFKTVEGISIPHKQIIQTPQGEAEVVIDSIEINPELEADALALPEDVQALIDDE